MNVELGKADIIWLSSLMFPHPLILRICEKFDTELHQGCYVVSSRRLNTSKRLKFIKTKKVIMSWNTGHVVYCYIAMGKKDTSSCLGSSKSKKEQLSDRETERKTANITRVRGPEILDFFLLHERQGRPGRILENNNDEEKGYNPNGPTRSAISNSNEENTKNELLSLAFLDEGATDFGDGDRSNRTDQSSQTNHNETNADSPCSSLEMFADLFAADK
uniref:Uncharacterized protein n=1 Tax=Bigelowiella natans TaxID=227086 RepID=A0A7S2KMK1_BIGNA|mmetsp:Transcript_510/g.758  ORF Transcript_510/g.758 Transcript_510/m.758 type:complete len:218 (+) Transcript_510:3-656(+)